MTLALTNTADNDQEELAKLAFVKLYLIILNAFFFCHHSFYYYYYYYDYYYELLVLITISKGHPRTHVTITAFSIGCLCGSPTLQDIGS